MSNHDHLIPQVTQLSEHVSHGGEQEQPLSASASPTHAHKSQDAPCDPLPAIISEACNRKGYDFVLWSVEAGAQYNDTGTWIRVGNGLDTTPQQGWKLHVSATVASAEAVLRRVLPVLLQQRAYFKVAASLEVLALLNQGGAGMSQIGKFITVYPQDDVQAVQLARTLHEATLGLPGPLVPSDHQLQPGSLVHYRYGGFDSRYLQTPLGEIMPALSTPDGELVADKRLVAYYKPEWVSDPFVAAGIVDESVSNRLIAGKYMIVGTLHVSPRGAVHMGVDLDNARCCVLKQARRYAMSNLDGHDACDRLRHEEQVLARLAPDPRFPTPFELVEENGDLFLAMEDVEGTTLKHVASKIAAAGQSMSVEQVVAWGREIAEALEAVHAAGFVYRDLKPTNVIVAPGGQLRLIDLELCLETASQLRASGLGTRGYMSPQQKAGQPPSFTDDVYSLGALLYGVVTGAEPSMAPQTDSLLDRPIALVNPACPEALVAVVERCLHPEPAMRFQTMRELAGALASIPDRAEAEVISRATLIGKKHDTNAYLAEIRSRYREMAKRVGDSLCRVATKPKNAPGLTWASCHPLVRGGHALDINIGSSGAVLALAELVSELADPTHRAVLEEGAECLVHARDVHNPLPGLYVGQAGIGAALLRAGQALGQVEFIDAAAHTGRLVAKQTYNSPDLFNGAAGRLRFHLWLLAETGEREHLQAALEAGEWLLSKAQEVAESAGSELCWAIPSGYSGLSGNAYLGYAHGAAGIADALLDLFEATADGRFLLAAQSAGRWLVRQAVVTLRDGSGLDWPSVEGGTASMPFWCHGAAGIGRFFLHAAELDALPQARSTAERAAASVIMGARAAGPTQCHGLSGNIEFVLDAFQATGDYGYMREVWQLARLLEAFATERGEGLVWSSESPTVFSPDYMTGYAGVAMCLLRLAAAERLPHQLSLRGFQYKGQGQAARQQM